MKRRIRLDLSRGTPLRSPRLCVLKPTLRIPGYRSRFLNRYHPDLPVRSLNQSAKGQSAKGNQFYSTLGNSGFPVSIMSNSEPSNC